jgi:ribonuclease G
MIDEILCTVSPGATRVALRQESAVTEFLIEPAAAATLTGNVYLGRIAKVLAGMGACFVEIGQERAGFLPLPNGERAMAGRLPVIHEGAAVLVQVVKDPQGGKGAELTLDISLPGRHVVYAPQQDGVVFSRRLTDAAERQRLAAALATVARPGEGFILRTAALGATPAELARDAEWLRGAWADLAASAGKAKPPSCLWRDLTPLARVLRDRGHDGIRRVLTDDRAAQQAAQDYCRRFMPGLTERIELAGDDVPLFARFAVDEEIAAALRPRAALPSGGFLLIEPTQALTAIDVNTGRHVGHSTPSETILGTNLEAAAAVARQVRLRNLSGLIVVDFVHMQSDDHQARVLDAVREAFAEDPLFVRIGGFTELGLMEIARRRARPPLHEILTAPCAACDGMGRIDSAPAPTAGTARGNHAERAS